MAAAIVAAANKENEAGPSARPNQAASSTDTGATPKLVSSGARDPVGGEHDAEEQSRRHPIRRTRHAHAPASSSAAARNAHSSHHCNGQYRLAGWYVTTSW